MTSELQEALDKLAALIPDPDDYWYIEDRGHDNERGQYLRFVIDRRPVEYAAGRPLYVNEQADKWAANVIEAARDVLASLRKPVTP